MAVAPAAPGVDPAIAAQMQAAQQPAPVDPAVAEQQSRVEEVKAKIMAEQKSVAEAEDVLGGPERDEKGKRVNKVPGRYTDTFRELKALADEGKISPTVFEEGKTQLIAALQTQDNKTLQNVRKKLAEVRNPKPVEPAKAEAPAPAAPAAPAAPTPVAAPAPPPAAAPVPQVTAITTPVAVAPPAPKPIVAGPRRVPKAAAPPAPKPAAPRAAAPVPEKGTALPKFDNEPELADAIAKENKLPQAVSDAWMRAKVLGESHSAIAADLGVGKATIGDWVRKMDPLMEAAKPARLERNAETSKVKEAVELVVPENQKEVEDSGQDDVAPDQKAAPDAVKAEEEEGDISDLDSNIEMLPTGDLVDEDNVQQGQEARDETDSHIQISDSPHGEGKTGAGNNIAKDRSAKLEKTWAEMNARRPEDKRVAWKDLGSAQQDAFDAEARKGAGRAMKAHAALSESALSGARYMEADRIALMIVNGADGKINGVEKLTTPDDMLGEHAAFPVLAALPQSRSTQGFTYDRPDDYEMPVLLAAFDIVSKSAASPMFSWASKLVDRVGTFMPQVEGQNSVGAAFVPQDRAVIFNSHFIPDAGQFHKPPMATVQMVVHEYTHAADAMAGKLHTGTKVEATSLPNSPTLVYVDIDFVVDKVSLQLGPVVQEALDAYVGDTTLFNDFDQALGSLMLGMEALQSIDYKISGMSGQGLRKVENIADRATSELTPKLMEMYLASPKWLEENLPRGYAHAHALANAGNIRQATAILGGLDVGVQGQESVAVGSAAEVRESVRPDAAPGADAVDGRLPLAGGEVAGEQDDRAGADAPAEGLVRASELKLPALAGGGRAGIKAYAKSITDEGGPLAKLYRTLPGLLGALSTEQLAERFSEHPLVRKFSDAMQHMGGLSNSLIGEANVVIRDWEKANKAAGKQKTEEFGQLLLDSTTKGMWPNKEFNDPAHDYLKPATPDTVKSTQAERDAYDAAIAPLRAEHDKLVAAWDKLTPAHRELYEPILKVNRDNFDRHVAADRKSIIESYYPGLDDKTGPSKALIDQAAALTGKARKTFAAKHGTTDIAEARFRDLWESIDEHRSDYDNKLDGPYFPKSRFGDHIVSYKSPEYAKAEAEAEAARAALSELKTGALAAERSNVDAEIAATRRKLARASSPESKARHEEDLKESTAHQAALQEPLDAAKKLLAERTKTLNDMKANDSHYAVEFHENRQTAVQRVAQLEVFFGGDGTSISRTTRDQYLLRTDGTTPAYMTRISDHLAGSMTGAQADEIRKAVREMHIQHLPGSSALKNQLKRKNVPGVKSEEALRSFSAKAIKDGYAISRKTYMGELHEHMAALRYNDSDEDSKLLGNELAKRMALNASLKSNKVLEAMTNYTYFAQLGMSPGFMLQQATQMWINTAPMMAARHGVGTTTRALGQATKDAAKLMKVSFDESRTKMSFALDYDATGLTEGEQAMLKEMVSRGRVDIASSHDAGFAADGSSPGLLGHAAAYANWPAQQLEVLNRVATALAGYRTELAKQVKDGADMPRASAYAEMYADRLISETHMNYASENRARFIHPNSWGGWGRIMFQFRAYQQGMVYLTLKNVIDGMRGNREALKAAGYMAGIQFGTGGLAGMPMTATMLAIGHLLYSAFGDDDEDRDMKEAMYQGIKSAGGEALADLITKGIPAALGVDMSEKLGAGHIFDPAPFVRNHKDGRDTTAAYFMSIVGGAAGGQVAKGAEALHQAGEGNFAKAAMLALPKAASDVLAASEFQRNGLKDTRGNTILSPDEISATTSVLKALGMAPTAVGRVQDERGAFFTARTARNDARAKLVKEYAQAKIAGESTAEIMERIDGFNERHSDYRIAKGSLPVAVQKRRELERNLRRGVPVTKRDQQLYEDVLGD
jgi:hypothetical protein